MNLLKLIVLPAFSFTLLSVAYRGETDGQAFQTKKTGLMFLLKTPDGLAVRNATIHIARSFSDLHLDKWIATRITDTDGKAFFAGLDSGYCFYEVNALPFQAEDSVNVVSGKDVVQTVTVRFPD